MRVAVLLGDFPAGRKSRRNWLGRGIAARRLRLPDSKRSRPGYPSANGGWQRVRCSLPPQLALPPAILRCWTAARQRQTADELVARIGSSGSGHRSSTSAPRSSFSMVQPSVGNTTMACMQVSPPSPSNVAGADMAILPQLVWSVDANVCPLRRQHLLVEQLCHSSGAGLWSPLVHFRRRQECILMLSLQQHRRFPRTRRNHIAAGPRARIEWY